MRANGDKFKNSRQLVWTMCLACIGLQLLALLIGYLVGEVSSAMTVLTVSIPMMLTLAGAWSGITNWHELRAHQAETQVEIAKVKPGREPAIEGE